MPPPPYLTFDPDTRRLRLDPHEPSVSSRTPTRPMPGCMANRGTFFWEDFGFWCFGGFDDVSRLLRDRRFGRQKPGGHSPTAAASAATARISQTSTPSRPIRCWSWSRRSTRGCGRWSTAPSSRGRSSGCGRASRRWPTSLIDRFRAGGKVDLLPAFAAPLPITIIAEMLGVPVEMGPQLLDWSHRMVAMYMHGRTRETEETANRAAREFSDFLRGYVAERRKQPGRRSVVPADLGAGGRPEAHARTNWSRRPSCCSMPATRRPSTRPAMRCARSSRKAAIPRRFFATPETTAATVEECLRFDAPLHMFTRYAYERDRGRRRRRRSSPASRSACCSAWPTTIRALSPSPTPSSPDRADQKNVSFGAGIHFCIGAPLARLELQVR